MATSFQDILYASNSDHSPQTRSPKRSNPSSPLVKPQDLPAVEAELKYQQLGKMYERRLTILKQSLSDAFGIAQSDNLLDTMKNDISSSEYAYERVKQIIEKCINDDREALVDKLCQENADLKSEYFKLDQQNLKAVRQYEERIEELGRKVMELKEKYHNEQRNKDSFEDEAKELHQTVNNLKVSNEQALRKKEEQIIKLKQEIQTLNIYKDQNEKLEDMMEENENRHKKLQQEHNQLQKEMINLRGRSKEQDKNINSLNSIIDEMQRIIDESQAVLKEKERMEIEYKCEIDMLQGKNEKLEASLAAMDNHEKLLKEEFNYKIEQIESEIINDRSNHEKTSATLENKYKTKIKQKQDKIYQFKEQLVRKDEKIDELEKHLKGISELHEKEIEDIRRAFEAEKETYERNINNLEDECQRRIERIKSQCNEESASLQDKFEKMLEKMMRQTQEEANHKIAQISEETRTIRQTLQRKEEEIKRDYIKIEYHEKLMAEKTNLVEHLRKEWATRESNNANEADLRLKEQREKLAEDYSIQVAILKNCMADLERQMITQQAQKRDTEKEINFLKETNQNLKTIIKELEFEKEKTFENISEWSIKMEKLREAYEEEQAKTTELKQQLSEETKNHDEALKHLNTACEDITKKEKDMNNIVEELEHLKTKYNRLQEEQRNLETEHYALRKDTSNRGNEQDIRINSLIEENKAFKEDNKRLKDKLADVIKEHEIEFEKMNKTQSEMSLKLRKEEDQARTLDFDLKVFQKQITDLGTSLSEAERIKRELNSENDRLKVEVTELSQGKEKSENKAKIISTKLYLLKKQIESLVSSKIGSIRTELRDLKKFYIDSFNLYVKETELKVQSLTSTFGSILRRKSEEHNYAIENVERLMKSEAELLVEKSALKSKQIQNDIVESYEHKCSEQERRIQMTEHMSEQIKEQNSRLQKELHCINLELNALKEENREVKAKLANTVHKMNNKEKQHDKAKKILLKEIDEKKKELTGGQNEFEKERKAMRENHTKEIEDLKTQLETLKQKYATSLSAYEHKMNSFSLKQFEEAEELENSYKESIHKLQLTLDDTIVGKDKLIKEAELLREKNNLLEKKTIELERAKAHIETIYYKNSQEYQETVDKLREGLSKEALRMNELRTASTEEGMCGLRSVTQADREEIKNERELTDLAFQNQNLQRQITDLEDRIISNNRYIQGKREKIRNYPLHQNLKDMRGYGVISPTFISPAESPCVDPFRWSTAENPTFNMTSPKLYKGYELQYASKTPKTKSYFLDQGIDRKIFSERGTMHSAFEGKGLK